MSVHYYSSADSGAPVLTGQAGSLINLFDALLVGSGTAYGSKSKAGWTKLFSGANKAVYRTADGVGHYRVLHDGSQGVASTREAVVRGAEGATDVDTLIDPFPTVAQISDATCVWRISTDTSATARAWFVVASENWMIARLSFGATQSDDLYLLGRFMPAHAGNAWPHMITFRGAANQNSQFLAGGCATARLSAFTQYRAVAMRSSDGISKSVPAGFIHSSASSSSNPNGNFCSIGPNIPAPDGNIYLELPPIWVNGNNSSTLSNPYLIGYFPNLWALNHSVLGAAARGDTFTAPAYNLGAQFVLEGGASAASNESRFALELTDTFADPFA